MVLATVIASMLLAAVMAVSFGRKVAGATSSQQLRDRLRVSAQLWQTIGLLELGAAAGLLAGIGYAPLGVAAAVGIALLMVGAVLAHARVGIYGSALAAPSTLVVLAGVVAALRFATA